MEDVAALQAELEAARRKVHDLESRLSSLGAAPAGDASLRIRVLDLSRVLAGPFCSMLLADLGAEVIKLERPVLGDDSRQFPPFVGSDSTSLYYVNLNRGKKSIAMDLKSEDGRRVFRDLVARCDVVLENFSPGTMARLGLGYADLAAVNPRLVYVSISGFGQTGPLSELPGYDIISQAASGLMSITGWPDSPPTRAGTAVGDIMAALFTCIGLLSALRVRDLTGRGQQVDISLVDSLFASMGQHLVKLFAERSVPGRIGNRYEFIYPYDSFSASDGWVIIAVASDDLWTRFLRALEGEPAADLPALRSPLFASNRARVEAHEPLKRLVEAWTRTRAVQFIVSLMQEHRVPSCAIHTLNEAANDAHIAGHRGMVVQMEQPGVGVVQLLGNPLKMSETAAAPRGPAPRLGEHTGEILRGVLGYDEEEMRRLKEKEVIFEQ